VSPPKLPEVPKNKWKPRHHIGIYDYNYKVGQSYYNPQTSYINERKVEGKPSDKPPECQTYAERFASKPIYGSAHGLPYAETESVFRQPSAVLSVGTRSRASSLTRDSGISQYLSSLGSRDIFDRAESKLSRHLADAQPIPSSRPTQGIYNNKTGINNELEGRRVTSLPPLKKQSQDRKVSYEPKVVPKSWMTSKSQEVNSSSYRDSSRSFMRPSERENEGKYSINLRSRRSSVGDMENNSSLNRKAKDEIFSISYAHSSRDEAPRYRSSQYFRDARKQAESEDIGRMVDRLRRGSWSGPRPSRPQFRV